MIRSLCFHAAFYIMTLVFMIFGSPLFLAPRALAMAGLKAHGRATLFLLRTLAGVRLDLRGREYLPRGPSLVASKHQSAWETFALLPFLPDPAMVLKAELLRIPLYGWYCRKFGMVPVERAKGSSALRSMVRAARAAIAQGRQIVIFPEGTRRPPGAPPDYKSGVLLLYESLNVPCVPIALNSGLCWPRNALILRPGTILVEVLPPLPPGLPRAHFEAALKAAIEDASTRLLTEAQGRHSQAP